MCQKHLTTDGLNISLPKYPGVWEIEKALSELRKRIIYSSKEWPSCSDIGQPCKIEYYNASNEFFWVCVPPRREIKEDAWTKTLRRARRDTIKLDPPPKDLLTLPDDWSLDLQVKKGRIC